MTPVDRSGTVPDPEMSATNAVLLRPLTMADLPQLVAVERAAYELPWSMGMFASELHKPDGICLGVAHNRSLVAHSIVSNLAGAWHVMNIAVHPAQRRMGLARRLLHETFELARSRDDWGYTLEVRVSNKAAISLYESFGFRTEGVRRAYYSDNREDALVMWKDPLDPTTSRRDATPAAPGGAQS